MVSISGFAYILIGAFIAGASKFVEIKSGKTMTLFFYIGIIFILIGATKLVLATFKKKIESQKSGKQRPQQHIQRQPAPYKVAAAGTQARPASPSNPIQHSNQSNMARANDYSGIRGNQVSHIKAINAGQHNPSPAMNHISIISCPACGIQHYAYANFCMICGHNLKRK
jgi:hypothetical protein